MRKPALARCASATSSSAALALRQAYDALVDAAGERAGVEYVRILHVAASTLEARVEAALEHLLAHGGRFDNAAVRPAPLVLVPRPLRIG